MVEITAKLLGRSVFVAGEVVECSITFSNSGVSAVRNGASVSKPKTAKLAWASAQIHCQCSVNETLVDVSSAGHVSSAHLTPSGSDTSFVPFKGEKGSTLMTTSPKILFCDLVLLPGETQTFVYSEVLPFDLIPSYRGTAVKYSYKITIGAQRFGSRTKLMRVPFRVLVVPGLTDTSFPAEETGELRPSNPFHQKPVNETSVIDIALENLQTLTGRRGPSFFNITNSRGRVARFCLFKQAYRIGDDIVGTCDFTEASVSCVQFSVTLQSEEQISESCRRKTGQGTVTTQYSKHDEFCLSTAKTHFSIAIPLTATPSFTTDLVTLRWRLHFEFVTSKVPLSERPEPKDADDSPVWQGPALLDVETMVWDLPVTVYATKPTFVNSISLLKTNSACLV